MVRAVTAVLHRRFLPSDRIRTLSLLPPSSQLREQYDGGVRCLIGTGEQGFLYDITVALSSGAGAPSVLNAPLMRLSSDANPSCRPALPGSSKLITAYTFKGELVKCVVEECFLYALSSAGRCQLSSVAYPVSASCLYMLSLHIPNVMFLIICSTDNIWTGVEAYLLPPSADLSSHLGKPSLLYIVPFQHNGHPESSFNLTDLCAVGDKLLLLPPRRTHVTAASVRAAGVSPGVDLPFEERGALLVGPASTLPLSAADIPRPDDVPVSEFAACMAPSNFDLSCLAHLT